MSYQWQTPSAETAAGAQIDETIKNLRVAMPVKVVSFNAKRQTVSCQPMIKATLSQGGSIALPILADVPVKFPRGGGFAVTFPISAGDEGIAIINDRCIDGWYQSGEASEPLDYRMHDLSDACFLPGFSSIPNTIPALATDAIVMRTLDNSAYLKLDSSGKLEINGAILTVKCPIIFENGMQGSGGAAGAAMILSGDLNHTSGSIKSNNVALATHTHPVTAVGADTGAPNAS